MYGTQTKVLQKKEQKLFENDVKMYGTQTDAIALFPSLSLRMM